jgi:hypothetical protein
MQVDPQQHHQAVNILFVLPLKLYIDCLGTSFMLNAYAAAIAQNMENMSIMTLASSMNRSTSIQIAVMNNGFNLAERVLISDSRIGYKDLEPGR